MPLLLALAVAQSAPMAMPGPAVPCPATPPALAPELAGWTAPDPLAAASTVQELGLATLPLGHGVAATLRPVEKVSFVRAPDHAPAPGSSGGMFAFTVTQAGRYRVALGGGPWVDVLKDGRPMVSAAHGHGPDCTGIRKMVDFALAPGKYVVQVSGATAPSLEVMVARLPA